MTFIVLFASGIFCNSPHSIALTDVKISGLGLGDIANYTCTDHSYFINGAGWAVRTCTMDGWTPFVEKCPGRLNWLLNVLIITNTVLVNNIWQKHSNIVITIEVQFTT